MAPNDSPEEIERRYDSFVKVTQKYIADGDVTEEHIQELLADLLEELKGANAARIPDPTTQDEFRPPNTKAKELDALLKNAIGHRNDCFDELKTTLRNSNNSLGTMTRMTSLEQAENLIDACTQHLVKFERRRTAFQVIRALKLRRDRDASDMELAQAKQILKVFNEDEILSLEGAKRIAAKIHAEAISATRQLEAIYKTVEGDVDTLEEMLESEAANDQLDNGNIRAQMATDFEQVIQNLRTAVDNLQDALTRAKSDSERQSDGKFKPLILFEDTHRRLESQIQNLREQNALLHDNANDVTRDLLRRDNERAVDIDRLNSTIRNQQEIVRNLHKQLAQCRSYRKFTGDNYVAALNHQAEVISELNEKLRDHEKTIDNLRRQSGQASQDTNGDIQRLRRSLEDTRKELDECRKGSHRPNNDLLLSILSTVRHERDKFEHQASAREHDIEILRQQIEILHRQIAEGRQRNYKHQGTMATTNDEQKQLVDDVDALKLEKRNLGREVNSLQEKFDEITKQLKRFNDRANNMANVDPDNESDLSDSDDNGGPSTEGQREGSNAEPMGEMLRGQEKEIEELTTQWTSERSVNDTLTSVLEDRDTTIGELNTRIADLDTEVANLVEQIAKLEQDLKECREHRKKQEQSKVPIKGRGKPISEGADTSAAPPPAPPRRSERKTRGQRGPRYSPTTRPATRDGRVAKKAKAIDPALAQLKAWHQDRVFKYSPLDSQQDPKWTREEQLEWELTQHMGAPRLKARPRTEAQTLFLSPMGRRGKHQASGERKYYGPPKKDSVRVEAVKVA